MKFIKNHLSTIVIVIVFVIGLGLLAYPTVANWWNNNMASHAVANYTEAVQNLDTSQYDELMETARAYNADLASNPGRFNPTDEEHASYEKQLSVADSSVMGSISVPSVDISLPIYRGTSEEVLAAGAGHLEGSSLPVGGIGTHTVITGHRGLPSAKLFTDLDRVVEDDYVILKVLNETLTYQVDTIRIVEPKEIEGLAIDPDKDLLTLVTCTPYGINTHRILITGHRVENLTEWEAASDAGQIDTKLVALCIAIPILIILFILLLIRTRKPKTKGEPDERDS
ncbi:class C sortase [uncultured Faecalibaculum sp.]|uniref:class C sortase n=1 Tax=uncultured Faecalibaculum sp. TaxID=1729681 RepID=UPI0025F54169|nr:class C sortase [uncultured Faecalibaculum sp.]